MSVGTSGGYYAYLHILNIAEHLHSRKTLVGGGPQGRRTDVDDVNDATVDGSSAGERTHTIVRHAC